MSSEAKPKKRFGLKRWLVIGLVLLGAWAACFGPTILKPVRPAVVLPAESVGLHIGSFEITNTIVATLLADLVLILLALAAWRFYRRGGETPTGIVNAFEAIVEFMWNTVEGAAGKWARRIFPVTATIFLLIFTANLIKLLPGFESIGRLEQSHSGEGYAPVELFHIGDFKVYTIDKAQPIAVEAAAEGEAAASESHGEEGLCTSCEVIPFLRGTATDINFPFALALVTVVMTQVYGVWAQGPKYFEKFFQIKQVIHGGIFGTINFAVGFLEIILEFAKILSFGFRLFGNVFAGALLLTIIGTLVPVILPAGLYGFEAFFGVIQAYVFFLLATIFLSMATQAHGHQESH